MKSTVLVGRKWHHPEIKVVVSISGIGIQMQMDDFLKALLAEIGTNTVLTPENLISAKDRVVDGMKKETSRVL